MFRAQHAQYAYRPELLERPSMARFVLLSLLLHAWMVLLFGDATGARRDGAGWSRSFFATLERAVLPPSSGSQALTTRASAGTNPTPPDPAATQSAGERQAVEALPPPGIPATPPTAIEAVTPVEFEKIPAIAVEVKGAVTPFAVAPIAIDPLAAPASTATPVVSPIPPVAERGAPKVSDDVAGFAVYVPPIIERAAVKPSAVPMPATPNLPRLAVPRVEREFQPYTPPPVAAVPAPAAPPAAPVAATVPEQVAPAVAPTPSPALLPPAPALEKPIEPLAPVLRIAPIAPITAGPATKSLETYRPRAVETPTSAASPSPAREAASPSTRNDGQPAAAKPSSDSTAATAIGPAVPVSPAATTGTGAAAVFNLPLPPLPSPANSQAPLPRPSPRLDLDALRRQARGIAVEGSGPKTLMPFPTVAKETPKKDMEKIFDKALKRPDCKDTYADLGLAAVVPLARDAVKDGGCKW